MEPKLLKRPQHHYAQYLSLNRFFRSSRIESLTPSPFGSDTCKSSSLPTMKMFESRVANWWFDAALEHLHRLQDFWRGQGHFIKAIRRRHARLLPENKQRLPHRDHRGPLRSGRLGQLDEDHRGAR